MACSSSRRPRAARAAFATSLMEVLTGLRRRERDVSEGALLIVLYPAHEIFTSLTEQNINVSQAAKCLFWVCAVQRRRFPVGANPTRQSLQPEAIGAVMEVTKWLKPSISVSRIGDSASVQAATRVNAEQSSKRTMRRSTRQPFRGRLIRLDEMSEAIRPDAAPG